MTEPLETERLPRPALIVGEVRSFGGVDFVCEVDVLSKVIHGRVVRVQQITQGRKDASAYEQAEVYLKRHYVEWLNVGLPADGPRWVIEEFDGPIGLKGRRWVWKSTPENDRRIKEEMVQAGIDGGMYERDDSEYSNIVRDESKKNPS